MIPSGVLVTVPLPIPAFLTVRMNCWILILKVAVTVLLVFIVMVHWLPLGESQLAQPANVEPLAGVAVRVTKVP